MGRRLRLHGSWGWISEEVSEPGSSASVADTDATSQDGDGPETVGERQGRQPGSLTPSPVAFQHERPTPKSIGREGMVTVWAADGLYLGCMGVETWKRVLAKGRE